MKVAVTARAADMATTHAPVPAQPAVPDQPAKVLPAAGAADRTTVVPDVKLAEQDVLQFMPDGTLVTVPRPVPAFV